MTISLRKTHLLIVGSLLGTFACNALADNPDALTLARNGRTTYRAVIAQDASLEVKAVAKDFQKIFREMTGATLPLGTDDKPMGEREIIIGPSKHLDNLAMYIDWDALGEEGYIIRTRGPHLALFGGALGGTRNAVYAFLDEHLGCRFYGRDFSVIPKRSDLSIGILHVEETPAIRARYVNGVWAGNPLWASRMRLSCFLQDAVHWVRKYETFADETDAWEKFARGPALAGSYFYAGNPERRPRHADEFHTLGRDMLVPSSLFEEHPDYFALRNGLHDDKRDPDNGICATAPGLVEVVAENAKDWIRRAPYARIISVSMADKYYACGCARCMKEREKEKWTYTQAVKPDGSHTRPARTRWLAEGVQAAGVFLDFVNRVADEIHKEFPDILVHTFAYYWTDYPPENWEPARNLVIDLAPLQMCRYHSLGQCEHNEQTYGYWTKLRLWTKTCPRVWVFDYAYGNSERPAPIFKHRGLHYRELAMAGVDGVMVHMCGGADQWLGELRAYVYAKLMWDPDYDVFAGIEEYCGNAYGTASEAMLTYILETQDPANYERPPMDKRRIKLPGYHNLGEVKSEALSRWQKLLDDGAALAGNDPRSLARVETQRRCNEAYTKSRQGK